jgi:hypothetical protein
MKVLLLAGWIAALLVDVAVSAALTQSFNGTGSPYVVADYQGGNTTSIGTSAPQGQTYLRLTNPTVEQNHVLYSIASGRPRRGDMARFREHSTFAFSTTRRSIPPMGLVCSCFRPARMGPQGFHRRC